MGAYVEGERAAKELGIRARGGFFENDGDYCAALLDGAFGKALVVRSFAVHMCECQHCIAEHVVKNGSCAHLHSCLQLIGSLLLTRTYSTSCCATLPGSSLHMVP